MDGAFQACRRNPAATFGTAIIIQAVIAVLSVVFGQSLIGSLEVLDTQAELTDAQAISFGASVLTGGTVLTIISAIGILAMQGLLVIPVARAILNLKTGLGQTWRLAKGSYLRLAGMALLMLAASIAGLAAFVFAVVFVIEFLGTSGVVLTVLGVLAVIAVFAWLTVKLALAPAALVLEPRGIFAAVGRSWSLTRGNWWRTFGILILTSIIVSIIVSVISTPITMLVTLFASFGSGDAAGDDLSTILPVLVLTTAISAFFGAIGYAFQAAVTSLLYVDLRMRREGFDVVLMREQEHAASGDPDDVPGRGGHGQFPVPPGPWPGGRAAGSR
ncbi:glycerophosphoryl diester phosphodiesterase membrane domain-containing protein [Arthrobacter caoxuetaonis]|uniref:Glycerophosphoryl diester phosphodiesterase membrane domain-containing protein n=1 Tax=Arthrobacter caoxuetaonis TaxID=2886935 RepID=A0A9X1SBQ3_9MICC|nr:glycerophosphoryl diester phosphodiesterase membrane domain-containing protein [Arthrobacter caoxuetaonis]MCC3296756.1 glycerophosphoryl diester phosphodiesterase membrane domain-containing protein [Arthrobacter caoxuetaonis]USQ56424.1 glycerophosphoryl diester phosphodiesterase membrane domain-containing protein [Arthrobacter caoxuetaonis]